MEIRSIDGPPSPLSMENFISPWDATQGQMKIRDIPW
jgi:hypothetical protein